MSKKVEEIGNQYTSDKIKGNDNKRKCVLLDEE